MTTSENRDFETLNFQKDEASGVAQRFVQTPLVIDMEESNSNWLASSGGVSQKSSLVSVADAEPHGAETPRFEGVD